MSPKYMLVIIFMYTSMPEPCLSGCCWLLKNPANSFIGEVRPTARQSKGFVLFHDRHWMMHSALSGNVCDTAESTRDNGSGH